MSPTPPPLPYRNYRVIGIRKDYPYYAWLKESLQDEIDPLNYFSFANTFNETEQKTNSHYNDLLRLLSDAKQSKRLLRLAEIAKNTFQNRKKSKDISGFSKDYNEYWNDRDNGETEKEIGRRQDQTVIELNDLTCRSIEKRAQEMHNNSSTTDVSMHGSSSTGTPVSNIKGIYDQVLESSTQLSSDMVGHLGIIDFSSETVSSMLQNELDEEELNEIAQSGTLPPISLSVHAQALIEGIKNTRPASACIREILNNRGHQLNFNLILHHDVGFVEKTVRHFIDLIDSPRNPLLQPTKERTSCISTIIHIIDELFLSNNDIVTLDWIENEYCQTGRSKWDGILLKVDNKNISMGLVEFSGGVKFNATAVKERSDIEKLYRNMLAIVNKIPGDVPKKLFSARYYDNTIYFEELFMHKDTYIRQIHSSFKSPTTIRSLMEYVSHIPKLLQWKEAVVNQCLNFQK